MAKLTCRDFERILDEYDADLLSESGQVSCELHLGTCSHCRELLDTWRAFKMGVSALEPEKLPPLVERAMVVEALSSEAGNAAPRKKRILRHPAFVPSAIALAASILLLLFVGKSMLRDHADVEKSNRTSLAHPLGPPSLGPSGPKTVAQMPQRSVLEITPDIRLWVRTGSEVRVVQNDETVAQFFLVRGHVVAEINKRPAGYRFVIETQRGAVEATGTVFSVKTTDGDRVETHVLRGRVEVSGQGRPGQESPSYAVTAGQLGIVGGDGPSPLNERTRERDLCLLRGCATDAPPSADHGEVALLTVEESGRLSVTQGRKTMGGDMETAPPTIEAEALDHGEPSEAIADASSPEKQSSDAPVTPAHARGRTLPAGNDTAIKALIKTALRHRKSGNYEEAARIYGEILKDAPKTAATLSCHVSLGQMELLELGRPEVAAAHFTKYLSHAPSGFLSEEARFGLVKSHTKIGDQKETLAACQDYIRHHKNGYASVQVLETQIKIYLSRSDCLSAQNTAALLGNGWPVGAASRRIADALMDCNVPSPNVHSPVE